MGGGPAGLYSAILLKKALPRARIEVYERNRPDDTFGWGVVFSDQTMAGFATADPPSHAAIVGSFHHWDDIDVHIHGASIRTGGHGFAGIERKRLLNILQERAAELGVEQTFQHEVRDEAEFADADLLIAADGVNSRVRQQYAPAFEPNVDVRKCRFIWLGTTQRFPAFTFAFERDRARLVSDPRVSVQHRALDGDRRDARGNVARARPGPRDDRRIDRLRRAAVRQVSRRRAAAEQRSAPARLRLAQLQSRAVPALVHAQHRVDRRRRAHRALLDRLGYQARDGRCDCVESRDRARRRRERRVAALSGGARARSAQTAERRAQSHGVVRERRALHASRAAAVHVQPADRQPAYRSRQSASCATRRSSATSSAASRERAGVADAAAPPMFLPFKLRDLQLVNRVVVSPMAQYSAIDGVPNDWHLVHYGARATGGAGLVVSEMTCVSPHGRISPGCTGLWNETQRDAWQRIVGFVHEHIAGEDLPAARAFGPQGLDAARLGGGRPSAARGQLADHFGLAAAVHRRREPGAEAKRARTDIATITAQFVTAAQLGAAGRLRHDRAAHGARLSAGELPVAADQSAHGSSMAASVENRVRFPAEVIRAVRAVMPAGMPLSVRISASDWAQGGLCDDELIAHGAGAARSRRGRARRIDRPDRAVAEAGLRPDVPDAVLRLHPQHAQGADDRRRQHLRARSRELDRRVGARRSVRRRAAASGESELDVAGRGAASALPSSGGRSSICRARVSWNAICSAPRCWRAPYELAAWRTCGRDRCRPRHRGGNCPRARVARREGQSARAQSRFARQARRRAERQYGNVRRGCRRQGRLRAASGIRARQGAIRSRHDSRQQCRSGTQCAVAHSGRFALGRNARRQPRRRLSMHSLRIARHASGGARDASSTSRAPRDSPAMPMSPRTARPSTE